MNNDVWEGNHNRAPTVENVLNGNDGLIAEFLAMNKNNQWAAVGFKGCIGPGYVPYAGIFITVFSMR